MQHNHTERNMHSQNPPTSRHHLTSNRRVDITDEHLLCEGCRVVTEKYLTDNYYDCLLAMQAYYLDITCIIMQNRRDT